MFDPYGALLYTSIFDWLLHISNDYCCNQDGCIMCHNHYHLLVHVTLTNLTDCHKNNGPYPTMSYYKYISQLVIDQGVRSQHTYVR